jgi:hypothetical protein
MAITTSETQLDHYNKNIVPIMHSEDSHPSRLSLHEFDKEKPSPSLKDQHFWTKLIQAFLQSSHLLRALSHETEQTHLKSAHINATHFENS